MKSENKAAEARQYRAMVELLAIGVFCLGFSVAIKVVVKIALWFAEVHP